jgi:hypothetical protein
MRHVSPFLPFQTQISPHLFHFESERNRRRGAEVISLNLDLISPHLDLSTPPPSPTHTQNDVLESCWSQVRSILTLFLVVAMFLKKPMVFSLKSHQIRQTALISRFLRFSLQFTRKNLHWFKPRFKPNNPGPIVHNLKEGGVNGW